MSEADLMKQQLDSSKILLSGHVEASPVVHVVDGHEGKVHAQRVDLVQVEEMGSIEDPLLGAHHRSPHEVGDLIDLLRLLLLVSAAPKESIHPLVSEVLLHLPDAQQHLLFLSSSDLLSLDFESAECAEDVVALDEDLDLLPNHHRIHSSMPWRCPETSMALPAHHGTAHW